jgi:ABC-2 type transport system permease protein
MSPAGMVLTQIRFVNRSFWRNPPAAFFTFVFPLMFLVLFNGIFGNAQFFVPGIAAFGVVSACFTNVAMQMTFAREEGVLKRVRGTPLPPSSYILGKVLHSTMVAILLVAIVAAFGALFYDVDLPTEKLGPFLVSVIVGSLSFSTLGLAFTALIPNEDAAPALVNAAVIPLAFISDVFAQTDEMPGWMKALGDAFPLKHFTATLDASFPPESTFDWGDVAFVAAWGIAGLLLAIRFFRWEPHR